MADFTVDWEKEAKKKGKPKSPKKNNFTVDWEAEAERDPGIFEKGGVSHRLKELSPKKGGTLGAIARIPLGGVEGFFKTTKGIGNIIEGIPGVREGAFTEGQEKDILPALDAAIEATGGRDIYSGIGSAVFDVKSIGKLSGLTTRAIPKLAAKKGEKLIPAALKGGARAGLTGLPYEAAQTGSLKEGAKQAVVWAGLGAAAPIAAAPVKKVAKVVINTPAAQKTKEYLSGAWGRWMSDWDVVNSEKYGLKDSGFRERRAELDKVGNAYAQEAKNLLDPIADEHGGKVIVYEDGTKENLMSLAGQYLRTLRTRKMIADGKENLLPPGEKTFIADMDAKIESLKDHNPQAYNDMMDAAKKLHAVAEKPLELAVRRQMFGAKDVEDMAAANPIMVQLNRVLAADDAMGNRTSVPRWIRRFVGSEREIKNPVVNIFENYAYVNPTTERMVYQRDLVDYLMQSPSMKDKIRVVEPELVFKDTAQRLRRILLYTEERLKDKTAALEKPLIAGQESDFPTVISKAGEPRIVKGKGFEIAGSEYDMPIGRGIPDKAVVDAAIIQKGIGQDIPVAEQLSSQAKRKMKRIAVDFEKDVYGPSLIKAFELLRKPQGLTRNQIAVTRISKGGRAYREVIEIDDTQLADAINMNPIHGNPIIREILKITDPVLMPFKKLLQWGVTTNPKFVKAAFVRDVIQGLTFDDTIMAKREGPAAVQFAKTVGDMLTFPTVAVPRRILYEIPKSFAQMVGMPLEDLMGKRMGRLTEVPRFVRDAGALSGEFHGSGKQNIEKYVKMQMERPASGAKRALITLKYSDKNPLAWAENLKLLFERSNRLILTERAVKSYLKKAGVDPNISLPKLAVENPKVYSEAINIARRTYPESLTNFSEMGSDSRALGRGAAFWTAGLGGGRTTWRAFKRNPVGTTYKAVSLVTGTTLGLWLKNKDKQWYKDLDTYSKNAYLWLDEFHPVEKPFELGYFFGTLPERMMDMWYNEDPKAAEEAARGFVQSMPAGLPEPSPIKVGMALATNKEPFFRTPINSPYEEQGEIGYLKNTPSTSLTGKLVSKGWAKIPWAWLREKSGNDFDMAVRNILGKNGSFAIDMSDEGIRMALRSMGKPVPPTRPGKTFTEKFTGKITNPVMERSMTRWGERFQEYLNRAKIAKEENDETTDLYVSDPYDLRMYDLLNEINNDINNERKDLSEIMESDRYSEEYKKERLKEYYRRTNTWKKYAVTRYEKGRD